VVNESDSLKLPETRLLIVQPCAYRSCGYHSFMLSSFWNVRSLLLPSRRTSDGAARLAEFSR
jgi:hypothetical protein